MNPAPPVSLWPDPDALGPLTDLYELTMMAGYYSAGMAGQSATFELFVRADAGRTGLPGVRRTGTSDRRPAQARLLAGTDRVDPSVAGIPSG